MAFLDDLDALDALDDLNREEHPGRIIRDRSNPMELYTEEEFRKRYRFTKTNARHILEWIEGDISAGSDRNFAVSSMNRLLLTLRFYATGNFQITDGDLAGVHQTTVSRIVKRVSAAIARRRGEHIVFPNRDDERKYHRRFYEIAGFPGVIGAIDGCHIPVSCPRGNDAELFRNRKGYFSINVQGVSGASLEFINIVARWPGSTHDARIFENSNLCGKLENNEVDGLLLGDPAYPCRRYLMTPFAQAGDDAQRRYNDAQRTTRGTVERMFGLWKRRFPCLKSGLRTKMETSLSIIVATAVLHNVAIEVNDPLPNEDEDHEDDMPLDPMPPVDRGGNAKRLAITRQYFG